jgi:hypothetical protein
MAAGRRAMQYRSEQVWGALPVVHPPKILLLRGRAELDVVEGIPEEYLQMNGSYTMTPEQRLQWEAEVCSLYDGMVRIVVTPTW